MTLSMRHSSLDERSALVRAYNDPVIYKDERVFQTLLRKESKYLPSSRVYLSTAHVQPEMRKRVSDWMLDVCEHQSMQNRNPTCPPEVFCLAMNYMDRFLSICSNIASSQLQLLGAVCLLVAWKVREHEPLAAQRLVEYSDFTLTLDDIMEWEVLLLSKLEWDMSAVIAFDFVEHIIQRLERATLLDNHRHPLGSLHSLRSQSEALITMCSGHHDFSNISPCLIAAACVLSTLRSGGADDSKTSASSLDRSSSSVVDMSTSSSSSSSSLLLSTTVGQAPSSSSTTGEDIETMLQIVGNITLLDKDSIRKCISQVEKLDKDPLSKSRYQGDDSLVQAPSDQAHPELVTSTPMRRPPSHSRLGE